MGDQIKFLHAAFFVDAELGKIYSRKSGLEVGCRRSRGYIQVKLNGVAYRAHRVIWAIHNGSWPEGQIDHRNGNRSDNRITNLRDCSHSINMQNKRYAHSNNKSGFLGVSRNGNKFVARIKVNGCRVLLGSFGTAEEAHSAYVNEKRKRHEGCSI